MTLVPDTDHTTEPQSPVDPPQTSEALTGFAFDDGEGFGDVEAPEVGGAFSPIQE